MSGLRAFDDAPESADVPTSADDTDIPSATPPRQLRPINRPQVMANRLVRSRNTGCADGCRVEHASPVPGKRRFAVSQPPDVGAQDGPRVGRIGQSVSFTGSSRGSSRTVSDASPHDFDAAPAPEQPHPDPRPPRAARSSDRVVARFSHTLSIGCAESRRVERSPTQPLRISGIGSLPTFVDDDSMCAEPAPGSGK
jgi:hypothetical protein